jgi:hypothetical protein
MIITPTIFLYGKLRAGAKIDLYDSKGNYFYGN